MLKWVFLGAKEQGLLVLETLARRQFRPSVIITLSESPAPEREQFQRAAKEAGCIFALDTELENHTGLLKQADMALVCRFSLLPESIFSLPRLGSVNVHNSLLPRYRGVHPVHWALVNGEPETGVTLHSIDAGIDTGAIVMQKRLRIKKNHDINTLTGDLNALSADMCGRLFEYIHKRNRLPAARKPEGPSSYARRRTMEDSRIDWNAKGIAIFNLVRTMQPPLPPAFCHLPDGSRIDIVSCDKTIVQAAQSPPGTVIRRAGEDSYWISCGDGIMRVHTSARLTPGIKLL